MIGQTASAGFQIGVRRTFPLTQQEAWDLLLTPEGLALWLGELRSLELEKGHKYCTSEGTCGELRVVKPLHQLRLTWQPENWSSPSTLQIRVIPNPKRADATTISFHQEKLENSVMRERMKERWEDVSAQLLEVAQSIQAKR
ncbi:SRPBCC domain-containing protein [Paenibacillus sp. HJGM_3]|uniref:SRPBCC domain-containing protein n=1 Tax=Paenibacillus sp. HJGM_3 TaxID=3379816 RepID=UPI00385EE6E8